MFYKDSLDLIGNTPIVEIGCFDTGNSRLFLKLENQNPSGSIKDRIGKSIIESAEARGLLKPGATLIEATAGNTGLGLALVALKKGYKLVLVIPDKMSAEKIAHLKALGAKIVMTRSDVAKGHPEYYQDYALRLSQETENSFFINQFCNLDNPLAHSTTTGPEIWQHMDGKVDAIVVGVGSGGTLRGLTDYFKTLPAPPEFVLADPAGSILADYIMTGKHDEPGSWYVEGIGEDFVPEMCDFSLVKAAYTITDAQAFATIRALLKKEGILAGTSSGVLIAAAVRYAQQQVQSKNIITFVCDTGNKYLSKVFNDDWMRERGFSVE
jgi:cystathionine beta-synthase